MARMEIRMPQEYLDKLKTLGEHEDRIAEASLNAGAEVVHKHVRSALTAAIGQGKPPHRSTGQLLSALGVSPVRVNRDGGHDVKIGFSEPRQDGGSNAMVANILEYGKHNQPARPFLAPAKKAAKKEAIAAMQRALEEEIRKL